MQQPLSQSLASEQGCLQMRLLPRLTQVKPSQHARSAQLPSSPVQSPASAPGLEQFATVLPASPVQKHDASSKVMHVYAAQYGRSGDRLGSKTEPSGGSGIHTFPSS